MPARDGEEPLPPLRAVIARHGLSARRSLGQNFLLDLNLTGRIVREARAFLGPRDGDLTQGTVIEIGPGPGGLTRALLDQGTRHLVAIETDRRCLAALAELESAYPGRLELTEGDATRLPVASLGEAPRRIVANLPYNVATTLLLQWLTVLAADPRVLAGLVLLFQKEVAARLAAAPRSKDYGRLSVIAQWLCEIRLLFEIPSRAFTPPPKVTSSLVGLRPRPAPLAPARLATLERVTAAAFGQRRKMLRQSLKSLGGAPELLLEATGLSGTARAEELSVEDFCALANALDERDTDATGHEN